MKTNLPETVVETICQVVMKQLSVDRDQVQAEADLKVDLGADSLDMVEMAMNLEEKLELGGGDEEMDGVQTVGDLYAAVERRLELAGKKEKEKAG